MTDPPAASMTTTTLALFPLPGVTLCAAARMGFALPLLRWDDAWFDTEAVPDFTEPSVVIAVVRVVIVGLEEEVNPASTLFLASAAGRSVSFAWVVLPLAVVTAGMDADGVGWGIGVRIQSSLI